MIYWKVVNIPGYKDMVKLLWHYQETYSVFGNLQQFWNPLSDTALEKVKQTGIFTSIESRLGKIKEVSALILHADSSTLHIDHTAGKNTGVQARLNIPVLNCNGSFTAFFKIPEDIFDTHGTSLGGTKYWSDELRNSLIPETQTELIVPTILRTSEPHSVFCKTNKFPRISLTMSFEDDVVRLLDN